MKRDYSQSIQFWPEYKAELKEEELERAIYFIYYNKSILVKINNNHVEMPKREEVSNWHIRGSYYLGELQGKPCLCGKIDEINEIAQDFKLVALTDDIWEKEETLYCIAIKAMQLMLWDENTKYCGKCGERHHRKENERAKVCPNCGKVEYPRISPAIIVGVYRNEEVLLAHNKNFKEGLYSIIAGFVEQGESLEDAVRREVCEEVGIHIKNIQYVGSKTWSTGDSLMLGFIAEYESGEISPDGEEIVDADWYNKDKLPPKLPVTISIARKIINKLLKIN